MRIKIGERFLFSFWNLDILCNHSAIVSKLFMFFDKSCAHIDLTDKALILQKAHDMLEHADRVRA